MAWGLVLMSVGPSAQAATIWDGPLTTYSQPGTDPTLPANQDALTAHVIITRAATAGIFNAAIESVYTKPTSPDDTEWAVGDLADALNLTYGSWYDAGGGKPVLNLVGQQLVLHLITDDIYLSVKFTALGAGGLGGFSYIRSTPAAAAPAPTVSITNPAGGNVYAAPASVMISATASVASGSVTNVAFFANTTPLGGAPNAPFNMITGPLSAGPYTLSAVATAGGIATTSAPINITVVAPIAITASPIQFTNGTLSFDYSADPGLRYVVERSTNLVSWIAVETNSASSNPARFNDVATSDQARYYRVGRLPNP